MEVIPDPFTSGNGLFNTLVRTGSRTTASLQAAELQQTRLGQAEMDTIVITRKHRSKVGNSPGKHRALVWSIS